jgi:competence protein ComEA
MHTVYRLASRITLAAVLLAAAFPVLAAPAAEGKRAASVININSADAAQLALLPRVGPSLAQKILDYRKKNGPFKSTDDLMLVQGIGEKSYQLLKPYLTLSGETTLREKVKAGRTSAGKEGSR